jgi:hypothetical protein
VKAGVKVTVIAQVPLAAMVLPLQVSLVITKSARLTLADVNGSPTTFGLVSVTVLGALVMPTVTAPNWSDDGENVGASSVPVPCRLIDAGVFFALLVTVRAPVRAPDAVGLKFTVTVQLLFAGSTPVHPSVTIAKSPEMPTLLMVKPTVLLLVRVAVLVALVWPTIMLPNERVGDRLSNGATPLPLRLTNCGLLGAVEGTVTCPLKLPTLLAVNVTWVVHCWVLASVTPEQVSFTITKFANAGVIGGALVVAAVIVPTVIGPPD